MTMAFELVAEARTDKGKGASRRLRRDGLVPAILYGAGQDPTSVRLVHHKVLSAASHEAFASTIVNVKYEGKTEKVVVKNIQRHPFKPQILHVDFQRISAHEKLHMHVPLHFMGEDLAPGVKQEGGIFAKLMVEVEVHCLPADLPEFIAVDVSELKLHESIHLSQLKLPHGVEIPLLIQGADHDLPVISIHMARAVEVAEEETPAAEADDAAAAGNTASDNASEE